MPTAMLVVDSEDRIADLNPAARRLFGLPNQGVVGQPARQVLGPEDIVETFVGLVEADTLIELGEGDDREIYRVIISPLDEQTTGVPPRLALISNVTERVRAKEALEQTNRQLLALQESTAALTALLEPAELFDRILEQLERMVDYEGATVTLLRKERLEIVAARGFADPSVIMASGLDIGDNAIFQEMAEKRAPLVLADVGQDPRWKLVEGTEFTRAWIGA